MWLFRWRVIMLESSRAGLVSAGQDELAPSCRVPVALPSRECLERFQPDLLAWRGVGMQRLRDQTACPECQAARSSDLVVVPVPRLTKLRLQLFVLLLEVGNFAGRHGLGGLEGTLPASERRLQVEYALAQQVVLGLCQCQRSLAGCSTHCLDYHFPLGAPAFLPFCIAYHDESRRFDDNILGALVVSLQAGQAASINIC